jgi:hypothetical protein
VDPEVAEALARVWDELPEHARTPNQTMGRHTTACEGTHGVFPKCDFACSPCYQYLRALAVDENDTPRFEHLSFAGHFDTTMVGRRGAKRPAAEHELDEHRRRFYEMFQRLEREYGITHYLAHNMTVTPANVDQIPDVIRACRHQGWRLFAHQPAAFVGNPKRWAEDYRELTNQRVWERIEEGAGTRLPYRAIQVGDERCNRDVWGLYVGDRYLPLLDGESSIDMRARDAFFDMLGGMDFYGSPGLVLARMARAIARHPLRLPAAAAWAARFLRRAGVRNLVREPIHAITFGAGAVRRLTRVTIPALAPSLAMAALLAFLVSWAQYGTSLAVGGGLSTLPIVMLPYVRTDAQVAAGLSLLMIIPAVASLLIALRWGRRAL